MPAVPTGVIAQPNTSLVPCAQPSHCSSLTIIAFNRSDANGRYIPLPPSGCLLRAAATYALMYIDERQRLTLYHALAWAWTRIRLA